MSQNKHILTDLFNSFQTEIFYKNIYILIKNITKETYFKLLILNALNNCHQ